MIEDYDGHKFENIASGADNGKTKSAEHKELLKRMEARLKGKAAVTATDKLKSYPVCLAAKGDVSLEMERIMEAMGGGVKAERVLQVNLDHPIVKSMDGMDDDKFADCVTVLYNEALIAEGYKTEPEFLSALNRLIGGASCQTENAKVCGGDKKQPRKKPAAKKAAQSATTDKPESGEAPTEGVDK